MADRNDAGTKSFPGSPTGNRSGASGAGSEKGKADAKEDEPTAAYPGSPTGNASGAGATEKRNDKP